jgi:ATP-dependent Lhr-like helicase
LSSRISTLPLASFSPSVRDWFTSSFGKATRAQELGWPAIAAGEWTLICAPTGSGKTLTAFLWALNQLMFTRPPASKAERCRVVYISPLKALAVDVERNLRSPLAIEGHPNSCARVGWPKESVNHCRTAG